MHFLVGGTRCARIRLVGRLLLVTSLLCVLAGESFAAQQVNRLPGRRPAEPEILRTSAELPFRAAQQPPQPLPPLVVVASIEASTSNGPSASSSYELDANPLRSIRELGANISIKSTDADGKPMLMPPDVANEYLVRDDGAGLGSIDPSREWASMAYRWNATWSNHRPLYFEDYNLERYGLSAGCVQPAVSAAHFYYGVAILPLAMVMDPPHQRIYTLGHYRPGDCAPYEFYWPRLRCDRPVVHHYEYYKK